MRPRQLARLPVSRAWTRWLTTAIHEQETELEEAIHPRRGTWRDAVIGAAALLVVVAASTVMERAATTLGGHFGVADIVTGGLVLAVVTSLPNAVAAIYLARRGRGAAALSTALNSNALNVAAGPAAARHDHRPGPAHRAGHPGSRLVRGPDDARADPRLAALRPAACHGALIIAAYLMFVANLLVSVAHSSLALPLGMLLAAIITLERARR